MIGDREVHLLDYTAHAVGKAAVSAKCHPQLWGDCRLRRLEQSSHVLKTECRLTLDAGLQCLDMNAQALRPVGMLLHQGMEHLEPVWHGQAAEIRFSALAMRSSPEISLGRRPSRRDARLSCSRTDATIRAISGSAASP